MGINSRSKGVRGELEAAEEIRKRGYDARRGRQFSGGDDSPDVVHSIPGIHLEVKYTEKFRMWPAIDQANNDCKELIPVVMTRKSHRPWMAILSFKNFIAMKTELEYLRGLVDQSGIKRV